MSRPAIGMLASKKPRFRHNRPRAGQMLVLSFLAAVASPYFAFFGDQGVNRRPSLPPDWSGPLGADNRARGN